MISHPQALAQCDGYLRAHALKPQVFYDTAGAVKHLKALCDGVGISRGDDLTRTAAIASRRAAEVYGMNILEEGIEDNPANFTRFLVVTQEPAALHQQVNPQTVYKTTIVFTLKNEPGALFKALSVFALRDLDLTKMNRGPWSAARGNISFTSTSLAHLLILLPPTPSAIWKSMPLRCACLAPIRATWCLKYILYYLNQWAGYSTPPIHASRTSFDADRNAGAPYAKLTTKAFVILLSDSTSN